MQNLDKAEDEMRQGHYHEAADLYRRAIDENPRSPHLHVGLARAFLRLKMYGQAEHEALTAQQLDPSLALPHVLLAYAKYAQQDLDGFRREAARAHELSPDNSETLTCFGIMLELQGDRSGSIEAFRAAIRLEPYDLAPRRNLIQQLRIIGDRTGALDHARAVMSIRPSARAALELASVWHDANAHLLGVVVLLFLVAALVLRSTCWLIVPALYSVYGLALGFSALVTKGWRVGIAVIVAFSIVLGVIGAVFAALQ